MALLLNCPHLAPTPGINSNMSVPSSPQNSPQIHVPRVDMKVFEEYQALKRNIGVAEREILTLVYK
jgi:hypothetical protein